MPSDVTCDVIGIIALLLAIGAANVLGMRDKRRELKRLREAEARAHLWWANWPHDSPYLPTESKDRNKAAWHRSIELLLTWLSPAQLAQFETKGEFEVVGGLTGRRYLLRQPGPYNIYEVDDKGEVGPCKICIVPETILPDGDILLIQKLSLELDECEALRIANRSIPYPYTAINYGGPEVWHDFSDEIVRTVSAQDQGAPCGEPNGIGNPPQGPN